MRSTRFTTLAVAAAIATLALAACRSDSGGGSDGGGGEDGADITEAIEQAATSDSAERCTEFQTQAFTEQTEFEAGNDAIESCEEGARDGDVAGDSVDVEDIEVDGGSATASVSFTGGSLGGQVIDVSLVKDDEQWKLDALDRFTTFDKAAFTSALVARSESNPDTPSEVSSCVEGELNAAPDDQLQQAFLSGEPDQLLELFGGCFG
ncbi:hypothetical protein BH20ACT15_BH20ACT15_09230 [soil metagenome]